MAGKSVIYSSSEKMDRSGYAQLLRRIADKVESGTVAFQTEQGEISFELPESVIVDIELTEKPKRSGKKFDFEIEADWMEGSGVSEGIKLA
jgi:amphi-Trp domain-containing protein